MTSFPHDLSLSEGRLPSYDRPPVVETILGIQFAPLPDMTNAHLGAFWRHLGAEWSNVRDAPVLEPSFERFSKDAVWSGLGVSLKFHQDPASRLQIQNTARNRMVQIQNGRMHLNWLGKSSETYPRYEQIRADFQTTWEKFRRFVGDCDLGVLDPNQWEITYLNHIERGTVWSDPREWSFFRPLGNVDEIAGLTSFESFGGEWHFIIPPERGRLHVNWRHSMTNDPQSREIIVLTLTARGSLESSSDPLSGLDLGRRAIVKSFRSLMSDEANAYWGMHDDSI